MLKTIAAKVKYREGYYMEYKQFDRVQLIEFNDLCRMGKVTLASGNTRPYVTFPDGYECMLDMLKGCGSKKVKIVKIIEDAEQGRMYKIEWEDGFFTRVTVIKAFMIEKKLIGLVKCIVTEKDFSLVKFNREAQVKEKRKQDNANIINGRKQPKKR